MRSYEAARSLFSMLSTLAWGLIVIGGILAFFGGASAAEMVRWNGGSALLAFFMGMVPGLGLATAGFWSLVFAQIGRAGVDTAEYSQQMLQISRDQLEVSRQTLLQGEDVKNSFAALKAAPQGTPTSASYADLKAESKDEVPGSDQALPASSVPETVEYKGREIQTLEKGYQFSGLEFASLEAAKSYVDELGLNPKAVLSSPS